jgi:hypothetical protein
MDNYLTKAIKHLKPTAEFVITNDDYSTIEWHVLDGDAPTQKQIDDAIKAVKAKEIADAKAQADAKAAAQAKLAALGLTVEDLTALGL